MEVLIVMSKKKLAEYRVFKGEKQRPVIQGSPVVCDMQEVHVNYVITEVPSALKMCDSEF